MPVDYHHQHRRPNISNAVSAADEVFEQFIALCQNAAPGKCALAGHGEPVAQRVAEPVRHGAPGADPGAPCRAARRAQLRGSRSSRRSTRSGSRSTGPSSRRTSTPPPRATRRRSRPARGRCKPRRRMPAATTSSAISCGDGPARMPSTAWPGPSLSFTEAGKLWGPVLAWWLWAPCAAPWPANATDRYTGPVERQDQDADPAGRRPATTQAPRTATPRSPSSGSATPCCSRWTARATRATKSPAPASTGRECGTSSSWSPRREARSANPTRCHSPSSRGRRPEFVTTRSGEQTDVRWRQRRARPRELAGERSCVAT